jgi:hypothetical protein
MESELKESADRLRRGKTESIYGIYNGNADRYEEDIRTIVNAYLALVPADDGEDADIKWLGGLSSSDGQPLSMMAVRLIGDKFHLVSNDYVSPKPATRGDVRDFCSALQVPLTESGG